LPVSNANVAVVLAEGAPQAPQTIQEIQPEAVTAAAVQASVI